MVAMSAVATSSIIHDIVTKIQTLLQNNLTNPHGTGNWVLPAYPELAVDYPIVIITHSGFRDAHLSLGTEYKGVYVTLRIEVWSQSTKQRDEIWDDIFDEFRHHYKTADTQGDSLTSIGLSDWIVLSCNDVDMESPRGRGHIHRKIAEIQFSYYAAT